LLEFKPHGRIGTEEIFHRGLTRQTLLAPGSTLGNRVESCQCEIHGVRSFLIRLAYQINAKLMAALAVFIPEALQFSRHELLPAKPDNLVRSDRRRPPRNSKLRH